MDPAPPVPAGEAPDALRHFNHGPAARHQAPAHLDITAQRILDDAGAYLSFPSGRQRIHSALAAVCHGAKPNLAV